MELPNNQTENESIEFKKIELYDFNKTFDENFLEGDEDKYIVIKISKKDNKIGVMTPDVHSLCLSNPEKLIESEELKYLIWDYDTIFGTRYNVFKRYDTNFFDCQERVFFEALIINYKRNRFKNFRWEKSKIGYELGIKRKKLDSIITRFQELGIIDSAIAKMTKKTKNSRNSIGFHFSVNSQRIIELLPEIFSDFDYETVERDILNYLTPDLVRRKR